MFVVVAVALIMSTLDGTIVATALPALKDGLHTSVTLAGWTITAYSLGLVLALSLAGKLCQRYGSRRVFTASVAVFTAASLCCGLVGNIYLLIVLRFIQAAGGAGFTPAATSIVVQHFGSARDKAVGLFGSFFTTGAMIGPVLGGLIVASWSWRGVFLVNVPLGIALIPLVLHFVPRDRPRAGRTGSSLDLPGVLLLGVGLLGGMIALTLLGDTPAGWLWPFIGTGVVGVAGVVLFLVHVGRVDDPLIAPRLIHGHGFGAVNLTNIVYGGAGIGLVALIPLYATTRFGVGALGSGLLLAAEGAGAIVFSSAGAVMLRRTGYRIPLYAASILAGAGALAVAFVPAGVNAYAWLAGATALMGIGLGWSSPASRNAGLQLVPNLAAPLAALRSTGMQVGQIAAVSIATAVIAHAADPGAVQAWVYVVYAAVLVLVGIPVVSRIPDHRGAW